MAEVTRDGIRYEQNASGLLAPAAALRGRSASASFTPTAVPYSAGDLMGAAAEFALDAPSGATIKIISTGFLIAHTALVSSEAGYSLYLYGVTPPSALADNAPWDLPAGDRASWLGTLALGTPVDLGSTLWIEVNDINKQVKLTGTSLFGYLATAAGITPTAAARTVTIHAEVL